MTAAAERQGRGMALGAAAIQAEAQDRYRQSVAAELPLSGKALGEMFDRGERWGRAQIAAVRAVDDGGMPVAVPDGESGTSQLTGPVEALGAAQAERTALPVPAGPVPVPEQRQSGTASGTGGGLPVVPDEPAAVTPAVQRATRFAVVVVAIVAAAVSYEHMRHLAEVAGEGWRAWLLPLSVDGLMVAASMVILVRKRQGLRVGALAGWSLGAGILASIAANVGASLITGTVTPEPWVKACVAAWPPLALLLAYELLMQLVRATRSPR